MKLNEFIKEKARERNYTMTQLAQECGYALVNFSHSACGIRTFKKETIEKIKKILDLNKFECYQLDALNIQDHRGKIKIAIPENANDSDIIGLLESVGHVISDDARKRIMSILRATQFGMTEAQDDMSEENDSIDAIIEITLKMTFMKDYITAKHFLLQAMHIYKKEELTAEIVNKVDAIADFSDEHPELHMIAKRFYEKIENDWNEKNSFK